MSGTDVAVIGVGCRFPDATTPEAFWRNLDAGLVSTRPVDDPPPGYVLRITPERLGGVGPWAAQSR